MNYDSMKESLCVSLEYIRKSRQLKTRQDFVVAVAVLELVRFEKVLNSGLFADNRIAVIRCSIQCLKRL